jgi:hypothetical protein
MFRRTADPSHSVSKNSRNFQKKRRSSRNWVDVRDLRCHASSCDFKTASVYAPLLRVSFNAVRSTAAVSGCPGRCWISMSFSWRDRWDDKRKTLYICMQKKKNSTELNQQERLTNWAALHLVNFALSLVLLAGKQAPLQNPLSLSCHWERSNE